uniref:Uncharacterized protein n=1 Tax=Anguilla anguilla TaxID=7936 RepID=A0A0E9VJC6_ANGAN
MEVYFCFQQQK